jgi:acetolactate synthase-1/2/3 large subunit
MATSGPGATNLITGLANALLDSVPIVAITGQVSTDALGTDAFQEVDALGMTMPVVKHGFLVRDAEELPAVLAEAFHIARSGRPGPVLVDLPKDIQLAELRRPRRISPSESPLPTLSAVALGPALGLLQAARRPVVYAGGGVGMAGAVDVFRTFVETAGIPTVTTLKGLGLLPPEHPLYLGMLGMHGLEAANRVVQRSDLLIVLGARFDDRVTGKLSGFAPRAKVLHVDVDAAELGKVRPADVAVAEDLQEVLKRLVHMVDRPLQLDEWREECRGLQERYAWDYAPPHQRVYAPRFLRALSAAQGPDGVICCDVGQHQMWVAQHCGVHQPENHLSSGGLGTMGYGLPAAIGAQLGRPEASVINVTGDGSFMMNVQELATLTRYDLPVKIVLLDNSCLGMVRQWQELFLEKRYSETDLSDNPDFCRVGRAFGMTSFRIWRQDQEQAAIERLLRTKGPVLLHVVLDREANVWPFVPPGKSNSTMMMGAAR